MAETIAIRRCVLSALSYDHFVLQSVWLHTWAGTFYLYLFVNFLPPHLCCECVTAGNMCIIYAFDAEAQLLSRQTAEYTVIGFDFLAEQLHCNLQWTDRMFMYLDLGACCTKTSVSRIEGETILASICCSQRVLSGCQSRWSSSSPSCALWKTMQWRLLFIEKNQVAITPLFLRYVTTCTPGSLTTGLTSWAHPGLLSLLFCAFSLPKCCTHYHLTLYMRWLTASILHLLTLAGLPQVVHSSISVPSSTLGLVAKLEFL